MSARVSGDPRGLWRCPVRNPDGTSESWTYLPDDVPQTWTTRDGVTVTHTYDAANRLLSSMPSADAGSIDVTLDAGDFFAYDALSRPLAAERSLPEQKVATPRWDLGSRPLEETVGFRAPLTRAYDAYDNPVDVTLPSGAAHPADAVTGWDRSFDTLDRMTTLAPRGTDVRPCGGTWSWGGADRLYGVATTGPLATECRYGYHGGPGPASSATPASAWRLGALQWGTGAGEVWGRFDVGWRPEDGTKTSRPTAGEPFDAMGWGYGYDRGVRLTSARSGIDAWGFDYGLGDERKTESRASEGLDTFTTGPNGRITARAGSTFAHDRSGRRTEDERFVYTWDWRGELQSVVVKDTWPDADGDGDSDVSPFAGHQIRFTYDAMGRLLTREHRGEIPDGGTEADRPFIEVRGFVWDGWALANEIGYGSPDRTQPRWRKTYVPGTSGLDDAIQVLVEVEPGFTGSPLAGTTRLYSYLRDEMGTVVGIVAEDETPAVAGQPPLPVRYLYTPYGEAHAELGPEVRRAAFDETVTTAAGVEQTIADPRTAAAGAVVVDWSIELDPASLGPGIVVEKLQAGVGWTQIADIHLEQLTGEEPPKLVVLPEAGWPRGRSVRVRLGTALRDALGRTHGAEERLEFRVPAAPDDPEAEIPPVAYAESFPFRFESFEAARATMGGRFPGGQTHLFHGTWSDPVTGISYHRARWYDPRNASWLSEDPLLDVDSVNLYAFVGWQPSMGTDPMGLEAYVIYREFSSPVLEEGYAIVGHYFLAFDERGLEDPEAWRDLVAVQGPQAYPEREENPNAETFSFHPPRVHPEVDAAWEEETKRLEAVSTLYTRGSYVGYNDRVDQEASVAWRDGPLAEPTAKMAEGWALGASQSQQEQLYRDVIASRNINNRSPRSGDIGGYRLLSNNCGSWARRMLEGAGGTWPEEASNYNIFGTGIGGVQDRLPFVHLIDAAVGAYGSTVGRLISETGGEYVLEGLDDDAVVCGVRWTF